MRQVGSSFRLATAGEMTHDNGHLETPRQFHRSTWRRYVRLSCLKSSTTRVTYNENGLISHQEVAGLYQQQPHNNLAIRWRKLIGVSPIRLRDPEARGSLDTEKNIAQIHKVNSKFDEI